MTTLELDDREIMALLLLLKVGMDVYMDKGALPELAAIEALRGVSNRTLDRLVAKVSLAGGRAAKAAHVGEA